MQTFDTIINLHGSFRGFSRIRYDGSSISVSSKGIPDDCELFFVYKNKAISYAQLTRENRIELINLVGVLVMQNGRIIMEGTVRGSNYNLSSVKRLIEYEQATLIAEKKAQKVVKQQPTQPQQESVIKNKVAIRTPHQATAKPKSEALQSILSQAKELFGEYVPEKKKNTDAANKNPRQNNVYNPFSATYPNSSWRAMRWRNLPYLESIIELEGERLHIQALPSSNVSIDYMQSMGFTKLTKADDGRMFYMKIRHLPK
ncbi:MAG: hypothetical protein GX802_00890 [Clostridiales bacterium]|nr:hypothetical protein [Clostridiales bacterium]